MPPPLTLGFASADKLTDHFDKHGARMGIATEAEYDARADAFLGTLPCPADVLECVRAKDGDTLRFRISTQEYGVLRADRYIRTYHTREGAPRNAAWFAAKCAET